METRNNYFLWLISVTTDFLPIPYVIAEDSCNWKCINYFRFQHFSVI